MGCGSCGTSNGLPKGCNNNGACGTDGCGKLSVFDWLSNMQLPNGQEKFNFVEVRFKNDRKFYYKNENNISLNIGDVIAVEGTPGHDIGVVTLTGELVRIQMKKKNLSWTTEDVKKVYRKANQKDIETWVEFRDREKQTMVDSRIMAKNLNLEMKICDVEYQGDGAKVTFYYTAEGRVDFRQLIKEYAGKFGVRIEMKQIGYRQEAAKVGGIGSCGRELCCSTWLTDFRSVSTAAARYQQLSINSQKLAGQCGKLKCCLNFELDSYLDALNSFPSMESRFETEKGWAHCVKIDVFKKEMWFAYDKGGIVWYKFSVNDIQEFLAITAKGQKTEPLEDLAKNVEESKPDFADVIGEDSLERFERKEKKNKKRKRIKNNQNSGNEKVAANTNNLKPQMAKQKQPNEAKDKANRPENKQGKNPNQSKKNNQNRPIKNSNPNQNQQLQNQPKEKQQPTQAKEQQVQPNTDQQKPQGNNRNRNKQKRKPNKPSNNSQQNNQTNQANQSTQQPKKQPQQNNQNAEQKPKTKDENHTNNSQPNPNKSKNRSKKRFNRGPKPNDTQQ
ncbi:MULTISPECIES: regulatory iron-sulfur-containing complex subunit RicT [unclassified Empedobacter]|uniref:regulatory iron-sulfur-containing complex subunit RicT n=2 Tax=Empedobacter TaxID=59734 RepID=UPI0025BF2156|nr:MULTISPECIES: regulatory iron-sulfur-containing complex subunit RicT [unclassified Empedobacter]